MCHSRFTNFNNNDMFLYANMGVSQHWGHAQYVYNDVQYGAMSYLWLK